MIIACPACATRYVVPDSAIGVEGRTVRCAKCKHSWFQDGPLLEAPPTQRAAPQPRPEPRAEPRPEPRPAPAPVAEPARPAPPPPQISEPVEPWRQPEEQRFSFPGEDGPADDVPAAPPPVYAEEPGDSAFNKARTSFDNGRSSFDYEPPFRPRRNRVRLWTIAAVLAALVSFGAIGAVAWYGLPDWMPLSRPTFADAQPDLVLDFPPNRQDRRTLPNGTEFFGASGTVTNVGRSRRTVPSILVVLRDSHDRIVYTWELVPPKRQLAPGESVTINEAVTDVPKSAKFAEIGWKPG